jgi:hypothetical protein
MQSRVATAGIESNGRAEHAAAYLCEAGSGAECHRTSRKIEESRAKEL